jgi:hypothetical protein
LAEWSSSPHVQRRMMKMKTSLKDQIKPGIWTPQWCCGWRRLDQKRKLCSNSWVSFPFGCWEWQWAWFPPIIKLSYQTDNLRCLPSWYRVTAFPLHQFRRWFSIDAHFGTSIGHKMSNKDAPRTPVNRTLRALSNAYGHNRFTIWNTTGSYTFQP